MVKDFEKYHGIVLTRFTHYFGELKVLSNINNDNSSYILNDKVGIYIKISKKRITPWQYTFYYEHHQSILRLAKSCERGYVVFVCNMDGICCITYDQYFNIINNIEEEQSKSISISRMKNEMYKGFCNNICVRIIDIKRQMGKSQETACIMSAKDGYNNRWFLAARRIVLRRGTT